MASGDAHQALCTTPPSSVLHRRLMLSRKQGLMLLATAAAFGTAYTLGGALSPPERALAALTAAVVVLWVSELLPLAATSLAIAPALVLLGISGPREAFAAFADPVLYIFVGAFMLTRAMVKVGLDQRLCDALLRQPALRRSPRLMAAALALCAWALSMWVSNTATAAALLPVIHRLRKDPSQPMPALMLAYACSIGGMATPVGTPPNLILLRYLESEGIHLSFVGWMAHALPFSALLMAATLAFMLPRCGNWSKRELTQHTTPPPLDSAAWLTLACTSLAILGWLLPSALKLVGSPEALLWAKRLHPAVVAVSAALPLYLLRFRSTGQPLLTAPEGFAIDWPIIFLFGGGIALGKQLLETGLAKRIVLSVVQQPTEGGAWPLLAVAALLATVLLLTELCSNTATAAMAGPIALPLAAVLGVPLGALGIAIALAASCAFALPVATGPNAIICAGERLSPARMLRIGLPLNAVALALLLLSLTLGLLGP